MKIFTKTIYILTIILCLAIISFAQTDWLGTYEFDEDGGETVGGSKIFIAHTLRIVSCPVNTYKLTLKSQGFQTSIDIFAIGKPIGNKLNVYFSSKGKDHHLGEYKEDDLLFSLEKKEIEGKTKILTYWEKFQPILDKNSKSGKVYFETSKDKATAKIISDEWVRYKTIAKGFSIAFPANSLVNNVKNKSLESSVYGYEDDVTMTLRVYGKGFNKSTLKRSFKKELTNSQDFQVGKYVIRRTTSLPGANEVSQTYLIASNNEYYSVQALAKTDDNPTLVKFLMSMQIDGKPLFKTDLKNTPQEKAYFVANVKTSPEVIEALNRKQEDIKRKVNYEFMIDSYSNVENNDKYSRPATIIEKPYSRLPFDALPNPRPANGRVEIIAKVDLLANGQVGDITFVKALSEKLARKCCRKSIEKIKFIPAQIDGKYVDSTVLVKYNYAYSTRISTRTIIR